MSGPVFGTSGTLLTGSAGTASFAVPASVASGDLIVVVFFLDGSNTVTAYPSGFAEAENSPVTLVAGGGAHSLHVVWKRAAGADTGTYDFTFASSGYREGAAHRYTGVVTSGTPFDSPTGAATDATNGTATPPVSTTTLGADRLLLFAGTDWAGGSWTPPTGYAERMDSGVGLVTLDDLAQAVAGGSGSISATSTGSNKRAAWIGGLIPAGAATSAATPQPLVVAASSTPSPVSVILSRAPQPPASPVRPLVVTARPPVAAAGGILSRGSLADAPVLTTVSPLVVTAPNPSRPGQVLLFSTPQAGAAPVAGPTTVPMVVTAAPRPPAATSLLLRGALVDAPVLTTASPLVVTSPVQPAAPSAIQVRNPQTVQAVTSGPVIAPIVVTAAGSTQTAAVRVLRAHLQDAIVATPGPLVITAPARVSAVRPIVARGSLADVYARSVPPLVITQPAVVTRAVVVLVAAPQFPATPSTGTSSPNPDLVTVGRSARNLVTQSATRDLVTQTTSRNRGGVMATYKLGQGVNLEYLAYDRDGVRTDATVVFTATKPDGVTTVTPATNHISTGTYEAATFVPDQSGAWTYTVTASGAITDLQYGAFTVLPGDVAVRPTALTRIAKNAAGTLAAIFLLDETPTDSTAPVTYAVVDATGASVASGTATHSATGLYTFVLPAQSALAALTVTWSATVGGSATTQTTYAEIVGGFFFSLAEGRGSDDSLADTALYPVADLVAARLAVESRCEMICDRAFVPRYDRVVLNGTGTYQLLLRPSAADRSIADVRTIRSVKMANTPDGTFVAFTAGQLAALTTSPDGVLIRTSGDIFTEGRGNVIVEFEYGLDRPPADLVTAALTHFRAQLNFNKSGIPDRASSFTMTDGGTFRLDMPGAFKTGIPTVDSGYAAYSRRSTGTGPTGRAVPASRTLTYTPQRGSMFHGWGRR